MGKMEIFVFDLNGFNWSKGKLIVNVIDSFRNYFGNFFNSRMLRFVELFLRNIKVFYV